MMREINGKPPQSFDQRCHDLNIAAGTVRERAVRRGYDLDGWRLARLMRDANTDAQVMLPNANSVRGGEAIPLENAVQGSTSRCSPWPARSVSQAELPHLGKTCPAIFPVEGVDEFPHRRTPLLAGGNLDAIGFRRISRGQENGFLTRRLGFAGNRP